jgi:hypothetical protein
MVLLRTPLNLNLFLRAKPTNGRSDLVLLGGASMKLQNASGQLT